VKLYVSEAGSADVRRSLERCEVAATSRVAYPEARSALARRRREGAISAAGLRRAVADLDRDLGSWVVVDVAESVAREAGRLAERHALRGFDAIHLASAMELRTLVGGPVHFLAFDARLTEAARGEGLLSSVL
jgi:predicted nucleic acid-binding protein